MNVEEAREALGRHSWLEAFDAFTAADAEERLEAEDLEGMAKAGWWIGRADASIEARERAYAAHVERGDKARAAFAALTLRREYGSKLQSSVAQGWLTRAEMLLEGEPESTAQGYLAIAHGQLAWGRGELDDALSHMERAIQIAGRFDDRDLPAWAETYKGMILVDMGRVDEGWLLMEAVSAAAVGGELGGYTTGGIFCNTINLCRDLADYGRATEWADAAKRWCERQAITGFPGVCRVHRAEVMRLVGAWAEAEQEVRLACDELKEFSPMHAGAAFHELGEVRLRLGDFAGAEEAFAKAHELGEDPQPGRTLLLLAEGKVDSAVASIRRSLDDLTWERLARGRLLPVQALAARATGDIVTAKSAADELASIAEEFGTTALHASAEAARGIVQLLEGDAEGAVRSLRRSAGCGARSTLPTRRRRPRCCWRRRTCRPGTRRLRRWRSAALERRSSVSGRPRTKGEPRSSLHRSRAELRRDPRRSHVHVHRHRGLHGAHRGGRRRSVAGPAALARRGAAEMLRDPRRGGGRPCGGRLLRGVPGSGPGARVRRRGPASIGGTPTDSTASRRRCGSGCTPRRPLGRADGFSGRGVHEAARIGALAAGGEIVASEETVDGIDDVTVSEPREVVLKGIASPVRVVTIDWR